MEDNKEKPSSIFTEEFKTLRKEIIEEGLNGSEDRFKILFDYAPDGYYLSDLNGNFIEGNKAAERITGYKREELIGRNYFQAGILIPKDIPKAKKALARNRKGLPTGPEEYTLIRKDGKTIELEISTYPIQIKGKTFVLGIARDIGQRKKREEILKKTSELLNRTERISKVGGWEYDMKTGKISWTDGVYRIYGLNKKNHDPNNIKQDINFYAPEERKKVEQAFKNVLKHAKPYDLEVRFINARNKERWVRTMGRPVYEKGELIKISGNIIDITQHKKTEIALKETEEKFKTLINQTPEALTLHDPEGNIQEINQAMVDRYGYSKKELLKMKIKDIDMDSFRREDRKIYWEKLKENQIVHFETRHRKKNGTILPVRVSLSAIKLDGQKYFLGLAEDFTEIKKSQQKLEKIMGAIIETISKIVDTRDPYTAGHQHRVYQLSVRIAQELNLPQEKIEAVRIAALIHDIGKIGIPSEILTKPTSLTELEFNLIKEHSRLGYHILKDIDFSYPIASIILQHHERNNGSGYPHHLKGKEILLEAKIIGIADVVESMCSHRPYRAALGIDAALEEISQNRGILYEPDIVDTCIKLFREKSFKFA